MTPPCRSRTVVILRPSVKSAKNSSGTSKETVVTPADLSHRADAGYAGGDGYHLDPVIP